MVCGLDMGRLLCLGWQLDMGQLIGASAVVTKYVMPYTIAVGVLAKWLWMHFPSTMIECLLDMAWWDRLLDKIYNTLLDMQNSPIKAFVCK